MFEAQPYGSFLKFWYHKGLPNSICSIRFVLETSSCDMGVVFCLSLTPQVIIFLELLIQHNGTNTVPLMTIELLLLQWSDLSDPHNLDCPDTTGHHSEADRFQKCVLKCRSRQSNVKNMPVDGPWHPQNKCTMYNVLWEIMNESIVQISQHFCWWKKSRNSWDYRKLMINSWAKPQSSHFLIQPDVWSIKLF